MHLLVVLSFLFHVNASPEWHHNIDEAKQLAAKEHKLILLNFSGSDWCGPCIRLHKEVFTQASFQAITDSSLILVNADFPRSSKNRLKPQQEKMNDALAEVYNAKGLFPYTVLIDANGKIIKGWDGFPTTGIDAFIEDIRNTIAANHP